MIRGVVAALASLWLMAGVALAQAPPAQDGFVPASSLPPGQEIPAGPLVLASYAAFLVLMMFYLWTIWQRINRVEKEMNDLRARQGASGR